MRLFLETRALEREVCQLQCNVFKQGAQNRLQIMDERCQFEIVLTFCVCPIQIGGGGFSAKYNSATKRFYCAALCLFASPARVEKTNLSGLHPNVNKASAFKAEIFRLDTGWLFKLPPPPCSVPKWKMANEPTRGSLRWRISWNSSSGWLLVIF